MSKRIIICLFLVLTITFCKKSPPTLESILFSNPPANPVSQLLNLNPRLKFLRVRINNRIRQTAVYQPSSEIVLLRNQTGRWRIFVGIIPEYFTRHSQPVEIKILQKQNGRKKLILSRKLDASLCRKWVEIRFEVSDEDSEIVFRSDIKDYGLVLSKPGLIEAKPSSSSSIVFILIDALRADHLGAYGYSLPTSPNIDELARQGTIFLNTITASAFTVTSLSSFFTALYPWEHRVVFVSNLFLARDFDVLAEKLAQAGYQTVGMSATYFHLSDFALDQGFELFDESCDEHFFFRDAECLTEKAIKWLEEEAQPPFFLYLHYVSTHAPYYPPEPFRSLFTQRLEPAKGAVAKGEISRFSKNRKWYQFPRSPTKKELAWLKALYDGEIRYADEQVGRLIQVLEQKGFLKNTLILITADHGEAFYEHKKVDHTEDLHLAVTKIPLILFGPNIPKARKIYDLVRSIDIAPTLLEYAKAPVLARAEGKSFLSWLKSPVQEKRVAYSIRYIRRKKFQQSLYVLPYHLLVYQPGMKKIELYRIDRDPEEKNNLASTQPELVRELLKLLPSYETVLFGKKLPPGKFDAETLRRLKSLGYME